MAITHDIANSLRSTTGNYISLTDNAANLATYIEITDGKVCDNNDFNAKVP